MASSPERREATSTMRAGGTRLATPSFTLSRTGPTGRSCRLARTTTSRRLTSSAGWIPRPTPRWIRPATSPSATPARTASTPLARTSTLLSGERLAASRVRDSSPGFEGSWAIAWLTNSAPPAIATRTAIPTNLRVTIAHRRCLDVYQGVLVPEPVIAIRLCAWICHPRRLVDHEHVSVTARFERKRH